MVLRFINRYFINNGEGLWWNDKNIRWEEKKVVAILNAYGKYLPLPHKKVHRKFMQQLMNDTRHSINNIAIESLANRKNVFPYRHFIHIYKWNWFQAGDDGVFWGYRFSCVYDEKVQMKITFKIRFKDKSIRKLPKYHCLANEGVFVYALILNYSARGKNSNLMFPWWWNFL